MSLCHENEKDVRVQIPFKPNHYQFTFYADSGVGKRVRRIYQGADMNKIFDQAKADAIVDYPEAHGFCCHSPQCDD